MFFHEGLSFQRQEGGRVVVGISEQRTENSPIMRYVMFTAEEWEKVIAECSPIMEFPAIAEPVEEPVVPAPALADETSKTDEDDQTDGENPEKPTNDQDEKTADTE